MRAQRSAPDPRARAGAQDDQLDAGSGTRVPHHTNTAQEAVLFAVVRPGPLYARPVLVATAGRVEYAARCPRCRRWHRHVSLGDKIAPCGARYTLQPRRGRPA